MGGGTPPELTLDCHLSDLEIHRDNSAYSPGWQHEAALLVRLPGPDPASATLP